MDGPILPLAGAAINGFFGRKASRKRSPRLRWYFVAQRSRWRCGLRCAFLRHPRLTIAISPTGCALGSFSVDFSFYLDQLSLVMMLVVSGVGFLIHIYSVGYMWDDDGYYRFMSYMNLFMFFMLTLVLAKNYLVMFIGWEGVGLASYLLIGYWFTKDSAAAPARKHLSSTGLATLDS